MDTTDLPRDFIGYGETPPHAEWPGGALIAVNFVINYEEGSENSIPDNDGRVETGLAEVSGGRMERGVRDLGIESMYEYGSRAGIWRLLRLFKDRDLPLTVFCCALALQRNPAVADAIAKSDYDICGHGWRWVEHYLLNKEEEREHISLAFETIKRLTGTGPRGWYCRYAPSLNTRKLLLEHKSVNCSIYFIRHLIPLPHISAIEPSELNISILAIPTDSDLRRSISPSAPIP